MTETFFLFLKSIWFEKGEESTYNFCMNHVRTSRDEILETCKVMFVELGYESLNIRSVALACGVSSGTIYNYFDSKSELLDAVVESIWHEIFHHPKSLETILDCIDWLYACLQYGNEKFPGFFGFHSFGNREFGKVRMQEIWDHIVFCLCTVLEEDENIQTNVFDEHFTPKKYANFIFSIFLADMIRQENNKEMLVEMVKRTLY